MALNMVDPYQWKLLCISNCLRLSNAHKKCTYKSRTISDTNCIQIIALPAVVAMVLNQITDGKVMETWPGKLAPFSKLALIFVVTSNSSKVAPYIRDMNMQRVKVALAILVLAASGYALGWFVAYIFRKDRSTAVSMMYGTGMRNISAGAVIAAAYFPGEVMFPVMIGTLFQQVLAALFGKLLAQKKEKQEFC